MGTVLIPEFMLLGQIVKREEAACSLLRKDVKAAKKKQPQRRPSFKSPTSPGHKPSLCSINEEAAAEAMSESTAPGEAVDDEELDEGKEGGVEQSSCGLSLFGSFLGLWFSFMFPSKR